MIVYNYVNLDWINNNKIPDDKSKWSHFNILERKFKDALQDVQREIAIMKKLNHKNVIKLHEVINNPNEDKFYMSNYFYIKTVIDYAYPGQLIEWDEDENKFFF